MAREEWQGTAGPGEARQASLGMASRGEARYGLAGYGRHGVAWLFRPWRGLARHGKASFTPIKPNDLVYGEPPATAGNGPGGVTGWKESR